MYVHTYIRTYIVFAINQVSYSTDAPNYDNDDDEDDYNNTGASSGASTGAIVGGAVGGLAGAVLLILLIILLWFCFIRRRRAKSSIPSMEYVCIVLCGVWLS